jgi:hypothetical protein
VVQCLREAQNVVEEAAVAFVAETSTSSSLVLSEVDKMKE